MFCPKCGKELADGMIFCTACGYRMPEAGNNIITQDKTVKWSEPVHKNKKLITIIAAAAVVVVLVVVLLGKIGKSSSDNTGFDTCDDAVNSYVMAIENKNKDSFVACFSPEQRESVEKGIIEWRKSLETNFPDVMSDYRFLIVPDYRKILCTVGDKESLSKEEIDYFNSNDYGYTVKEGYKVEIEVAQSWEAYGGTVIRGDTPTLYVGKIGKKWYVLEPISTNWYVD